MSKKRRMIVIAGLVMAMTSATVPAIVMTGCHNNQSSTASKKIDGEYYSDSDNFMLRLYETDYAFEIYFNGLELVGKYSFKGNALTLTVTSDGTVIIATVSSDKKSISLKYDGKDYDLELTTFWTLSFDTNGGSEIESQFVANGKHGVCPADEPTKPNYVFLGWYNSDLTTPFDFSSPLTGNKTAYAKYIEVDASIDNFTVTFNAGAGATVATKTATTVNGRIYKAPVPTKAGSTFVGWWVSNYGAADKLTYKYTDQILREDTTFFAVWDTDLNGAPAVSVTSSGVTWTASGVANRYTVVIYNSEGIQVGTTQTGSNTYDFDFSKKPAGDYKVEVTLNGKTTTAYYKNKPLGKVTKYSWKGSVLTFDPVENATDYYLTVECGNAAHIHTDIHLTERKYDFSACEMKEGGIKFIIEARADGYITSVTEFYIDKTLASITGLTVDSATETLKWNAVENATYYELEIVNGGKTNTYTLTTTSYDLRYLTGNISYKVTAKAHGYNDSVASGTYNKVRLATPNNIALVNGKIKWDAVDGATKYIISVNGTERETNDPEFSTNDPLFDGAIGSLYTIYVTAIGSSAEKNSLRSDKLEIANGAVNSVSYNNGVVSWSGVVGADKYGVKVNEGEEVFVTDANSLKVALTQKGANVIYVRFYNDDTPSGWTTTEVNAFEVKFDSRGGYQIGDTVDEFLTIYVASDDIVTLPTKVLRTGYTFEGWYTTAGGSEDNNGSKYGASATFGEDTTIYAFWTGNKYKVTLVATGGILPTEKTEYEVTFGSRFSLPVPESATGEFAFGGWYSEYNNDRSIKFCGDDGSSITTWNVPNDGYVLYPVWVNIFNFKLETDAATNEEYYVVSGLPAIKKVTRAKVPEIYNGIPVKKVEGECFSGCTVIKKIEIPDTIEDIALGEYGYSAAGSAFFNCQVLEEIVIYHVAGNTDVKYFSVNGVLYARLSDTGSEAQIMYCPRGITGTLNIAKTIGGEIDGDNVGTYTVTTISVNVLEGSYFNKVYIPSTVSTISDNAFKSCTKLEKVVFIAPAADETAQPLNINGGAFASCSNLISVTFPKRLASFDREMFNLASKLVGVYVSDVEEEDGVGENYASVNGLLCNVERNKIIFAGRGVGGEEGNDEGIFRVPAGITTIGDHAFQNCLKIKKLVIPAYVTRIEAKAFMLCPYIAEIVFEGDEVSEDLEIQEFAFCSFNVDVKPASGVTTSYNNVLTSVILPANLKKMGKSVFGGCNKLIEVTVNCNRTTVEYSANAVDVDITSPFLQRTYSNVAKVTLGKNCPIIEVGGIFGTKIEKVIVHPENPYYYAEDGVLYDKAVTTILYYPMAKTGDFEIPETVTTIGAGVFAQRSNLTGITIPGSVTTIGEEAFYNCTKLGSITFKEGSEPLTIGVDAFRLCNSKDLTRIEVPARCVSIGKSAFRQISYLEKIVLHEGLLEIGEEAFYLCYALKTITIPASVTKMGGYDEDGNLVSMNVFSMYLTSASGVLGSIDVAEGNTVFASSDGVLYLLTKENEEAEAKATDLLVCPAGKEGAVEILGSVKKIWSYAFRGTLNITEVSFGEGFSGELELGTDVFLASSISKISLPEGLSTIVDNMFKDCKTLEEIVVPSTVTYIGEAAFAGCTSLARLSFAEGGSQPLEFADCPASTSSGSSGGSTTGSSKSIIYNCKNLKTLELPERTTKIGNYAFSGYYYSGSGGNSDVPGCLESVIIPSTVTSIGTYAFYRNRNLTSVKFKDVKTTPEQGTLTIGDYAFYYCNLSGERIEDGGQVRYELQFSNTLKSIGANVFSYGGTFTSVKLPVNLESIGASAFNALATIKSVTLESGSKLREIGNNAFYNNTALVSFDFSKAVSLETIGASAFYGCKIFASGDLSNTVVTNIGAQAFRGCKGLTEVKLPATLVNLGTSATPGADTGGAVFMDCTLLTKVTFLTRTYNYDADGALIDPDDKDTAVAKTEEKCDLTYVGYHCFAKSGLLKFDFPVSTSSTISIGNGYQFEGCPSLTAITLSRSVTDISNLFAKCTSIQTITIAADNNSFKASTNADLPFILGINGDTIVYGYAAVPTAAGVYDLSKTEFTRIGPRAFEGQSGIKKIILPASIIQIDDYAFANCRTLEEVVFADGTVLTTIGNYAFDGCVSLKSIVIPNSVNTIGDYAFSRCANMKTVKIGTSNSSSIQQIGKYAFDFCTSLKTAEIYGNGDIGYNTSSSTADLYRDSYMFRHCLSLTDVTIYGTPRLGRYMFQYCTSLKTVTLNDEITQLSGYMFTNCTAFDTMKVIRDGKVVGTDGVITLPSKVTALGNKTSTSTSSNYYTGYTFENCTSITKVVMPDGIEVIGTYTFTGCSKLDTITYIDEDTGNEACNKGELKLPTSITQLSQYAFSGVGVRVAKLENLGDFTAHATGSASYMLNYLFQKCDNLQKVTFSSNVTELKTGMFYLCPSLATINYFDEDTKQYVGEDDEATFWEGLVFLGTNTSSGTFQGSGLKKIIIPSTLRRIDDKTSTTSVTASTTTKANTFKGSEQLTTIVMTKYTYGIGAYVFDGCINLSKIIVLDDDGNEPAVEPGYENAMIIPSNLAIIGQYAFQNIGATKLVFASQYTNPNTLNGPNIASRSVNTYAFTGCTKLTEIEYGWTTFYANMFQNCTELETVTIPQGLTALASTVFSGCENLATVNVRNTDGTLDEDNATGHANLKYIGTFASTAFKGCAFEKVTLKSSITTFGSAANMFDSCTNLSTIFVAGDDANNEEGVANLSKIGTLGSQTFLNCTSLKKVLFKNGAISFSVKETFKGCENLDTIFTLGDNANNKEGRANLSKITTAGTSSSYCGAFNGCAFEEVYMPLLTTGGYTLFMNCTDLVTVTISPNLINIGYGMFDGCENLRTVYTNGDDANNEEGTANLSKVTRFTSLATTTAVASYAFRNTAIEKVNLSSMTVISTSVNLFDGCEKLKEVILSDDLTTLTANMFSGTGLTTFKIGANITSIGTNVFANCKDLTSFTVDDGNTTYKEIDGAIYTADGTILVAFPVGYEGEFTLADGAVGAQAGALAGYHGVTKTFTLPVMENIPVMTAMLADSGIENLIIPEGVVTIADGAFTGVTSLKTVVIPSTVTTIGKSAFGNCTALEKVTFSAAPDGVDEVPLEFTAGTSATAAANLGAFGGCTALKNIVIPERATTIGKYTFVASGLESVTFHDKLTAIHEYAFNKCANLKTVDIPNGVVDFGSAFTNVTASGYIFAECTSLTKVTLPGTLERMSGYIFKGCTSLTTVNYHDAETGAVVGADGDITLPAGLKFLASSTFDSCTALNPSKISIFVDEEGTVNAGAQDIGTGYFTNCTGLTNVTLEGNLLKIVNNMFKGCTGLVSLDVKSPLTYIGSGAFDGCSALENFVIPETVTEFGGTRVFADCTSLKKLVIPASVVIASGGTSTTTTVGSNGMFQNWTSEQSIIIECNALEVTNWAGYWWMNTEASITIRLKGTGDDATSN